MIFLLEQIATNNLKGRGKLLLEEKRNLYSKEKKKAII